ncbi:hypothetical protein EKQ44_07340 [Sutcliffiella horikoshii]|nr:hypothetical protein [Sutcliffiella horikoshii]
MYKKWIVLGFIGILLIGGGFVVRGMQYDTPALKDSFTRDFIMQEEQAPEGFHVFESKIGTYTMLFPSDFQLISDPPEFYGRQGDFYEVWVAEKEDEEKKIFGIKNTYKEVDGDQVQFQIDFLKDENDRKKYYELYEANNLIIFLEKKVEHYDTNKKEWILGNPDHEGANVYYGFVADKTTNQTMELDYSIVCPEGCNIDTNEQVEFMKTMLESVQFETVTGND